MPQPLLGAPPIMSLAPHKSAGPRLVQQPDTACETDPVSSDHPAEPAPPSVLELLEVPRVPARPGVEDRARYLPWLRGPQRQLEFVINGNQLRDLLIAVQDPDPNIDGFTEPFDFTSVADLSWPAQTTADLRRLAGTQARDDRTWPLAPGRLPLYVCPICADLGCGAVTVHVDHTRPGEVTWSDLRFESGLTSEYDFDLSSAGTFVFDAVQYQRTLLEPVGALDALAIDERTAKAARTSYPVRRVRGLLERLRRP